MTIVQKDDKLFEVENGVVIRAIAASEVSPQICPKCKSSDTEVTALGDDHAHMRCKNGDCEHIFEHKFKQSAEVKPLEEDREFQLGDRVVVKGKAGHVMNKLTTMYGESIGIRFDDDSLGEFLASDIEASEVEKPLFSNAVEEVGHDWSEYLKMPDALASQVEEKVSLARNLNLRAKALSTDQKISFSDRLLLDRIVTASACDIMDYAAAQPYSEENTEYLNSLPKFTDIEPTGGGSVSSREDASWLDDVEANYQTDWDHALADKASRAAAELSREQLEDVEFVKLVQGHLTIGIPTEQHEKLARYFSEARAMRLAEPTPEIKEAAVEDLTDFDTSALFL
jgi:hypothetical protein